MNTKPMLMSGPMVQAVLAGRKTQTRRVVKPQPYVDSMGNWCWNGWNYGQDERGRPRTQAIASSIPASKNKRVLCTYGRAGDLLWVREAWRLWESRTFSSVDGEPLDPDVLTGTLSAHDRGYLRTRPIEYRADSLDDGPWRPSIHMPRWASRITLRITDVRVEPLREISEEDAVAEGIKVCPDRGTRPGYVWPGSDYDRAGLCHSNADVAFSIGWDGLNAARGYSWDSNPWVWVIDFKTILENVDVVLAREAA